jgi:hypothetical protein
MHLKEGTTVVTKLKHDTLGGPNYGMLSSQTRYEEVRLTKVVILHILYLKTIESCYVVAKI